MRYRLLHIVLILFAFTSIKAQDQDSLTVDEYVVSANSIQNKDKIRYQFSTGAEISFSNAYGSSTSLFYSPNITYLVSPRLIIGAGMTYVNSDVTNFRPLYDLRYQPFSGNISQYYTHITAKYKLNDRLIIGGSIFYNMAQFSTSPFGGNQKVNEIDKLGYSASFEYKISDKVSIFGEIRINDTNRNGIGGFNSMTNQGFGTGSFMGQSSFIDFPYGGR